MKIKKEKRIFHCSNTGGLSKRPVDLRNLITRIITTLFKVFGLHVEPCNRLKTFSLQFNFEKGGPRLSAISACHDSNGPFSV